MEEVQMVMMMISSSINETIIPQHPTTNATCPTWKLYDNPFFNHHPSQTSNNHNLHPFPPNSFSDLSFCRPLMETELDLARAQIIQLQAELQYERKARKRGETLNKRLAEELAEETRGREALERVCQELAREISSDKAEIDRLKREIEEERKMLRMAEVLREERVQMKLAEAKFFLEEKLLQLEKDKRTEFHEKIEEDKNLSGKYSRLIFGEKISDDIHSRESVRKLSSCNDNLGCVSSMWIQRRASPEAENPHIKRGIKGFVEFPRVVRAMGSKNRHWGTKLECQKAQLRILLRHKSHIRSSNLIIS